jgi:hypothetical protein
MERLLAARTEADVRMELNVARGTKDLTRRVAQYSENKLFFSLSKRKMREIFSNIDLQLLVELAGIRAGEIDKVAQNLVGLEVAETPGTTEELECPICYQDGPSLRGRMIRVCDAGHCVCQDCGMGMLSSSANRRMQCPLCRRDMTLGPIIPVEEITRTWPAFLRQLGMFLVFNPVTYVIVVLAVVFSILNIF